MPHRDLKGESVGELVRELTRGTTEIVRKEVQLARFEMRESTKKAVRAGIVIGMALPPLIMALVLIPMAIVSGFDAWWPRWAVALLAAGIMLVTGGALALIGVAKLRKVDPKPERAIEDVKEEKEWLQTRLSSSVRSTKSATT